MDDIMHRNLALPIPLHVHRVFQNLIKLIPQILPASQRRRRRRRPPPPPPPPLGYTLTSFSPSLKLAMLLSVPSRCHSASFSSHTFTSKIFSESGLNTDCPSNAAAQATSLYRGDESVVYFQLIVRRSLSQRVLVG